MTRPFRVLPLLLGLSCAGLHLAGSGSARKITILYTGDFDWTKLPQFSTLIKGTEPALSIIDGNILDGGKITDAFKGQAEVEALAKSGVTAVCLTPGLLSFGTRNTRRLIDSVAPGVFFLGANLTDSTTHATIGQPCVKIGRPGSNGGDRVAVIGLLFDKPLRPGMTWQAPEAAIPRALPQMKMNADLLGAVLCPSSDLKLPGFDFAIGSKTFGTVIPKTDRSHVVYQLDLQLGAKNQVASRHLTAIDLTNVEPDPGVETVVRNWQSRADSLGRRP